MARTGLHGANRLASNSLLEGLVVGERAGAAAAERQGVSAPITEVGPLRFPRADRKLLQELMSEHAAVVRDGEGLRAAILRMVGLVADNAAPDITVEWAIGTAAQPDSAAALIRELEDSSLTLTARALLVAAAARTESRGCHTRSDHPQPREEQRRSTAVRLGSDGRPKLVTECADLGPTWARDVLRSAC